LAPSPLARLLDVCLDTIGNWAATAEAYDALLLQVFAVESGAASAHLRQRLIERSWRPELQVIDGSAMGGALAGFVPVEPGSAGLIVINGGWLSTTGADQQEAVLLEELGHAIDHHLNGGQDTPGDEGEIFSALLRGGAVDARAMQEDDHRWITLGGRQQLIEAAAPGSIDLAEVSAGLGGFVINGAAAGGGSGMRVSGAGDVNGDGLTDLIIGAPASDPAGGTDAGCTFVVFGKGNTTAVNLSTIAAGNGGFVINGIAAGDASGMSVSSAGDVNGDGLGDLIVAAPMADPVAGMDAGCSYVVFGRVSTSPVNLSSIAAGLGGFAINGAAAGDRSGVSVSNGGDMNGDGLSDLIIGAPGADPTAQIDAGCTYVVFGKTSTSSVNLSLLAAGIGGFVINGAAAGDASGTSVSNAGDVNGDGFTDVIVGAPTADPSSGPDAGISYVVFGKGNTLPVNLTSVASGLGGFVINGAAAGDASGTSVSGAGDVNGDNLADLIVGAPTADTTGGLDAGCSYVVFGKGSTATVDLSAVATGIGGFVMNGSVAGDLSGASVASAGDVNADGLSDLLLGAPGRDGIPGIDAGGAYVVYGQSTTTAIDLTAVSAGMGGFVINGEAAGDASGSSVSAAGDVNGDGLSDLIAGGPSADPGGLSEAGRSWVVLGATSGAFAGTAIDQMGTSANDLLIGSGVSETLVGLEGADTLRGSGGADVLLGGSGNDYLLLDASNLAAMAHADGGSGVDTIVLDGSGLMAGLSGVSSIEAVDLAGAGNILSLSVREIQSVTGCNWLNSSTAPTLGLTRGTYPLSPLQSRHQMLISGDASNTLIINWSNGVSWVNAGSLIGTGAQLGHTYNVWDYSAGRAQLIVDGQIKFVQAFNGTAANDSLIGTAAADQMFGLGGNDTLNGKAGIDTLNGGEGDDTYIVDNSAEVIVDSSGRDKIISSVTFSLATVPAIEDLTLAPGINRADISGNDAGNLLTGQQGQNIISGGLGNDMIYGLAGNDTIDGGEGADTLEGGRGIDCFLFTTTPRDDTMDVITDWHANGPNYDQIFFSRSTYGFTSPGQPYVNPEQLICGKGIQTATTALQRFLYDTTTGILRFDPDGTGPGLPQRVLQNGIKTHHVFLNTDLMLFG